MRCSRRRLWRRSESSAHCCSSGERFIVAASFYKLWESCVMLSAVVFAAVILIPSGATPSPSSQGNVVAQASAETAASPCPSSTPTGVTGAPAAAVLAPQASPAPCASGAPLRTIGQVRSIGRQANLVGRCSDASSTSVLHDHVAAAPRSQLPLFIGWTSRARRNRNTVRHGIFGER